MGRKILYLCWALAAVSLFGAAWAAPSGDWIDAVESFAGGSGTVASPYLIATPKQLAYMADKVNNSNAKSGNLHYKLSANIDLSARYWTPIGAGDGPFSGVFDGGGYTITGLTSGLTSDGAFKDYQGLFGYVEPGGKIKNVGLAGADIKGKDYVGGIAGISSGDITNCYVKGSVSGTGNNIGGIAGWIDSGDITDCYVKGSVSGTGTGNNIGGIAGKVLDGSVKNCYVDVSVIGSQEVGGVTGWLSSGDVTNCVVLTSVSGQYNVGLVVGSIDNATLSNNYSSADKDPGPISVDVNGADGGSVDTANLETQSWWTGTGAFKFGSSESAPWDWDKILKRPVLSFSPFEISMDHPPSGVVGIPYSLTLTTPREMSFDITGQLPTGLELVTYSANRDTARIEGRPAETGTFSFAINAGNGATSVTREFTIDVLNDPTEILGVFVDGKPCNIELQEDGVWLISAPYGTDLSQMTPSFQVSYPNSTIISPSDPQDFSDGKICVYTIVYEEIHQTTYNIRVKTEAWKYGVEDEIVTTDGRFWNCTAARGANGSFSFVLTAPVSITELPSSIDVKLTWPESVLNLTEVLDSSGSVVYSNGPLVSASVDPDLNILRLTGVALDKSDVEALDIDKIEWVLQPGVTYRQSSVIYYGMIPDANKSIDSEANSNEGGGGGGGGCSAGLGAGAPFLLPALGAGASVRKARKKRTAP
jgi:hypothetical protein